MPHFNIIFNLSEFCDLKKQYTLSSIIAQTAFFSIKITDNHLIFINFVNTYLIFGG